MTSSTDAETRTRIYRDAGLHVRVPDLRYRQVQVRTRLPMDYQPVRSRVTELAKVIFGPLDHHVYLKRQLGMGPDRLDNRGAESDGRYEVAVHDVDMDTVRATLFGLGHLFAQSREIG